MNSGVTGGGGGRGQGTECSPSETFHFGNFWLLIGNKKKAREKGKKVENVEENEEKWRREVGIKIRKMEKNEKRKEENAKYRRKRIKKAVFFSFLFLLFTFRKRLKLFWGLPKWKF